MTHRIAAATVALIAVFGLSACSAAGGGAQDQPGDAGQTKEQACALVQQSIEEATTEFESVSASDPAAVVAAMQSAGAKLAATASKITNDDVAAVVPELQDMFGQVADVMDAIVKGDASKVDDLSELGTAFQKTSERFQEICTT